MTRRVHAALTAVSLALFGLVTGSALHVAPAPADAVVAVLTYSDQTCQGTQESVSYLPVGTDCYAAGGASFRMVSCTELHDIGDNTACTETGPNTAAVTLPSPCSGYASTPLITTDCSFPLQPTPTYNIRFYNTAPCDESNLAHLYFSGYGPTEVCTNFGAESPAKGGIFNAARGALSYLTLGMVHVLDDGVHVNVTAYHGNACAGTPYLASVLELDACTPDPFGWASYVVVSLAPTFGQPKTGSPSSAPSTPPVPQPQPPTTDSPHTVSASPSAAAPSVAAGSPTQAPTASPVKLLSASGDPHYFFLDAAAPSVLHPFECQTPGWVTWGISSSWLVEGKHVPVPGLPFVSVLEQVRITPITNGTGVSTGEILLGVDSWASLAGDHGLFHVKNTQYANGTGVLVTTISDLTLWANRYVVSGQQVLTASLLTNAAVGGLIADQACPGNLTKVQVASSAPASAGRRLGSGGAPPSSYSVSVLDNGTTIVTVPVDPTCQAAAGLVGAFLTACYVDVGVSGDAAFVNVSVGAAAQFNASRAVASALQVKLQSPSPAPGGGPTSGARALRALWGGGMVGDLGRTSVFLSLAYLLMGGIVGV